MTHFQSLCLKPCGWHTERYSWGTYSLAGFPQAFDGAMAVEGPPCPDGQYKVAVVCCRVQSVHLLAQDQTQVLVPQILTHLLSLSLTLLEHRHSRQAAVAEMKKQSREVQQVTLCLAATPCQP